MLELTSLKSATFLTAVILAGIIAHDTTLADLFTPDFELGLDGLDDSCIWLEYFED